MDGLASVDALAGAIPYLATPGWLANARFFSAQKSLVVLGLCGRQCAADLAGFKANLVVEFVA